MKNGVEAASIIKGKEKGKIVCLIIVENTDFKTKKGLDLMVRNKILSIFYKSSINFIKISLFVCYFHFLWRFWCKNKAFHSFV
ncbi:hypothetical protein [Bacillus sp. SH5-2]|uniref:hypothetical protein n=1 Tax=Bacillus sp. SH5-2 TaxID=2217834 RepID=UPI0011ED7783|nr:hypothetical protein [Bacillus sp. SH5-2]KAA0764512.1 hypothetical protein DN410_10645 [Bacillus sp. SH5-2]